MDDADLSQTRGNGSDKNPKDGYPLSRNFSINYEGVRKLKFILISERTIIYVAEHREANILQHFLS